MKETIKASIGGYVFTLDKDAYETLRTYLDHIKRHFQNKEEGEEIISDIEYRMSELLQMQTNKTENVITLTDANYIIEVMGNPKEFVDEENESSERTSQQQATTSVQKKLYRDTDNSVIAGVCSGIGQYFNFDSVILRVILVLCVLLGNTVSGKINAFVVLAYIVLWIITPAAKTIKQKISMSGQPPTVEDIESRNSMHKKPRGSELGKLLTNIIKGVAGILLFLVGLCTLISAFFFFFSSYLFDLPSMSELLTIAGIGSTNLAITLFTLWIIPAICFIYIAIKLITRITSKDLIILGVAFLFWIGTLGYITKNGVSYYKNHKSYATQLENIDLKTNSDTLYISIENVYKTAEPVLPKTHLYRFNNDSESWFLIPEITIQKDSSYNDFRIEIEKKAFGKTQGYAEEKAEKAEIPFQINDSVILLKPQIYTVDHIWNWEIFKITVYSPQNKEVIIENPIKNWIEMDKYPNKRRGNKYAFTYSFGDLD